MSIPNGRQKFSSHKNSPSFRRRKSDVQKGLKICSAKQLIEKIAVHEKNGTKSGTKKVVAESRAERVQMVFSTITEDPNITVRALVEDLGISKNTIPRILKELQENGTIKRKGSARKGYWVVL